MQKTTKSLLTKIFVLLAVIFCVFALTLGAIGCANEEEAKVITDIKVNGTTITVTYSDGTTAELPVEVKDPEIPEIPEDCGHNSNVFLSAITLDRADNHDKITPNADICGVELYECTVCKHIYAKETKHVLSEEATTVAATCAKTGHEGYACTNKDCKFVDGKVLDKIAHTWKEVTEAEATGGVTINKCLNKWISGGEVCTACGEMNLTWSDPINHVGGIDEFGVITYPTNTEKGTFGGHCDICNVAGNVSILDLPNLVDGVKDGTYEQEIIKGDEAKHYAKYTFTYEDEDYDAVESNTPVYHLGYNATATTDDDGINDYTAEKYPELTKMANATVICGQMGDKNMVYTCPECQDAVRVNVQAAHTKVEYDTNDLSTKPDKFIDGEEGAQYCDNGGYLMYECSKCDLGKVYKEEVEEFEHAYNLVPDTATKGEDGTWSVKVKCTECDEKAQDEVAKSVVEATCSTDGVLTRKDDSTITLPATGIHDTTVGNIDEDNNNTTYKYADVKDKITFLAGFTADKISCKSVNDGDGETENKFTALATCKTCKLPVPVTVQREHDQKYANPVAGCDGGTLKYNCGYENCPHYTSTGALEEAKAVTESIAARHTFTFENVELVGESAATGTMKVTCSECENVSAQEVQYTRTGADKKCNEGQTVYTYTFEYLDQEYTVTETKEIVVHKLNGADINVETGFVYVSTKNITLLAGTAAAATCEQQVANGAIFTCELCNVANIPVDVYGDHDYSVKDTSLSDTTVGCEKGMNEHYKCSVCDAHDTTCASCKAIVAKQEHEFVFDSWKDAEKTIAIVKCNHYGANLKVGEVDLVCELADGKYEVAIADCEDKQLANCAIKRYECTYTNSANNYELTFTFDAVIGGHTYAMNGEVKACYYIVEEGKISVAYFCTVCNTFEVFKVVTDEAKIEAFNTFYAANPGYVGNYNFDAVANA